MVVQHGIPKRQSGMKKYSPWKSGIKTSIFVSGIQCGDFQNRFLAEN